MEFFHKVTRFPFMATRRKWYVVSAVLILGSLIALAVRGLNFGIDFTGGVVMEFAFPQAANLEEVRALAADFGVEAGTLTKENIRNLATRPAAKACFAASGVPPVT